MKAPSKYGAGPLTYNEYLKVAKFLVEVVCRPLHEMGFGHLSYYIQLIIDEVGRNESPNYLRVVLLETTARKIDRYV